MLIEITDRDYWLAKVNLGIEYIENIRTKKDRAFEEQWRKRWFLPNRKPTEFPPRHVYLFEYPSTFAFFPREILEDIKKMLELTSTGTILLTEQELNTILEWCDKSIELTDTYVLVHKKYKRGDKIVSS